MFPACSKILGSVYISSLLVCLFIGELSPLIVGSHSELPGQPRLLYPAKLSITIDGETKVFHEKNKFTKYLSTNPALQRLITEKNQYKDGNHALEKTRR